MLYMIIGSVVGLIIGSFLVWKRNIHFVLSVLLNSIMTVVLFYIGLNIYVKVYHATLSDYMVDIVYAFFLFFELVTVFVMSILFLYILGLIQKERKKINNNYSLWHVRL